MRLRNFALVGQLALGLVSVSVVHAAGAQRSTFPTRVATSLDAPAIVGLESRVFVYDDLKVGPNVWEVAPSTLIMRQTRTGHVDGLYGGGHQLWDVRVSLENNLTAKLLVDADRFARGSPVVQSADCLGAGSAVHVFQGALWVWCNGTILRISRRGVQRHRQSGDFREKISLVNDRTSLFIVRKGSARILGGSGAGRRVGLPSYLTPLACAGAEHTIYCLAVKLNKSHVYLLRFGVRESPTLSRVVLPSGFLPNDLTIAGKKVWFGSALGGPRLIGYNLTNLARPVASASFGRRTAGSVMFVTSAGYIWANVESDRGSSAFRVMRLPR